MVTLVIEGTGGSELSYQLAKPMVSIGASSRNDIVLRAPGVAPCHLVIQRNGDVFTFLAQSRQVVVLNGERRSRGVLKVGDRVRIGAATVVFKGAEGTEDEVEVVDHGGGGAPSSSEARRSKKDGGTRRSEIVLFRENHRLSEARLRLVEIFRARMRTDLVPSLRTFFADIFPERKALIVLVDEEGRFQPVVSQWEGDLPRLPVRTFEELGSVGRYAVLRLSGQTILVYPVDRGSMQEKAFVLVETTPEGQDEDLELLGEFARMLSVHWDRVEGSASLFGQWTAQTQKSLESHLPGTSQAVHVLRDSILTAARSASPAMLCGRVGSGRMFLAKLIASLRPTGEAPVMVYQARADDDSALRVELFGAVNDKAEAVSTERMHGSVVVVRDIHLCSPSLQRELAAKVAEDLESGYGPAVRWMTTTGDDALAMLNEGVLDVALFRLFDRHVIRVPSLGERREDLPLLIVRLLERVGGEQGKIVRGIELETLNSLLEHSFEGQMTELLGELRRLVSATPDGEMVRGTVPRKLQINTGSPGDGTRSVVETVLNNDDLKTVVPAVENLIIDRVLRKAMGNQSRAARILNLSRGALIAKIKEYEIPDYRSLRRKG